MGYRGYEIWYCSNGHGHTYDVWCAMEITNWHCPVCEGQLYAKSSVDETNMGYDDDEATGWYNVNDYLLSEESDICQECGHLQSSIKVFDIERIIADRNAWLVETSVNPTINDACWFDDEERRHQEE
jgi:hypothetical protein